jgi:para-aminobenzoate synthetase/4-amino-4-deoxychorismate lyase
MASEYAECLLKARFFESARKPLELIETLRWGEPGDDFVRLASHLARMKLSAATFAMPFDDVAARTALEDAVAGKAGPKRVRLTLNEQGVYHATAHELPPNPTHWTYAVSPERTHSGDVFLRHKTNWRELYESESKRMGTDEVIFLNERGELTEGARSNIFIRRGDVLVTPPLSAGLLDGCLRAELIAQDKAREAVLMQDDLMGDVYFGNSLRGLIPAKRV